jgi:ribosomal protein S18 acetylase RimI-like enzyme
MEQAAEVRRMAKSDLDGVIALFDEVANERIWIGTEPGYDRTRYREVFGMAIERGNGMFVAVSDDRVVGIVTEHQQEPYGHMVGMIITHEYRGRGIGGALLDRLILWGVEHRFPQLTLTVFPHNERALRLYRSRGFSDVEPLPGGVRRANGEVWEALVMRKALR